VQTKINAKNYVASPKPTDDFVYDFQSRRTTSGRLATVLRGGPVTRCDEEFVTCTAIIPTLLPEPGGGRDLSTSGAAATAIRFYFFSRFARLRNPRDTPPMTTTAVPPVHASAMQHNIQRAVITIMGTFVFRPKSDGRRLQSRSLSLSPPHAAVSVSHGLFVVFTQALVHRESPP